MTRQYVQLWGWFNQFGRKARSTNDEQRLKLWKIHHSAIEQREKEPEQALAMFREGVVLAERLNEPCISLFYEYWQTEMMLFYLARYEDGLELAVKLIAKSSQKEYINCPVRARIYITLIAAYSQMDLLSYTDEISAMIETMENSIPLDDDTHWRLYAYRADVLGVLGDVEQAMFNALKYLEVSGNDAFRTSNAYHLLCRYSYIQNKDQQALEYAYMIQEMAEQLSLKSTLASSYLWQATLLALRGETQEAERLFLLGVAERNALKLPKEHGITRSYCRYYEVRGEYEKSLNSWDEHIKQMNPKYIKRHHNFYTFYRRCFLLRRMDRLTEADVEQTRQSALHLHKPERYFLLIDKLNDGKKEIPRY